MTTWTGYHAAVASTSAEAFCPSLIKKPSMPADSCQPLENSVTLRDAIAAKDELQDEINKLLDAFTSKTGLIVDAISLDSSSSLGWRTTYLSTISVSL